MSTKYTAIVTGASKGIGRAIATTISKNRDYTVIVNYSNDSRAAEEVVSHIKSEGGSAVAVKADVSVEDDVRRLFNQAENIAPIGILINNAGVVLYKKISEISLQEFKRIFDINVLGTFLTCREASQRMIEGGRIINLSSSVTALMMPTYGVYAASKGAVEQLTRVLAKELGSKKITVNAIAPGPVATELFFNGKSDDDVKRLAQMSALGRIGEPQDIASAVELLISTEAGWITGQLLRVNGGFA